MANINLTEIKLGAPYSIEGGASPNATLSVQDMSRCESVTLHDEDGVSCTADGALRTFLRLYKQKKQEES